MIRHILATLALATTTILVGCAGDTTEPEPDTSVATPSATDTTKVPAVEADQVDPQGSPWLCLPQPIPICQELICEYPRPGCRRCRCLH